MQGALFTTVNALKDPRGKVLRWTGTCEAPFSYEEVGFLTEGGAYIALHANRLFVTTWSAARHLRISSSAMHRRLACE